MTHILTNFAKRNIQTPATGLPQRVIPLVQRKERETYNEVIKPILIHGSSIGTAPIRNVAMGFSSFNNLNWLLFIEQPFNKTSSLVYKSFDDNSNTPIYKDDLSIKTRTYKDSARIFRSKLVLS